MGSDKRARQRAARDARNLAAKKRAKRKKLIRRVVSLIVIAGVVVGLVFIVTKNTNKKKTAATTTSSTTSTTSASKTATLQKLATDAAVKAGCPKTPATPANKLTFKTAPPLTIDTSKHYTATVKTTVGTMTITLLAKTAPKTVNSFVYLATKKFYNCNTFHRVIPGFMDQTGDPTGSGAGGPGYHFGNENVPKSYAPYEVAMANSGKPTTDGSQFFIVTPGGTKTLDNDLASGGYSLFGKVTKGQKVATKINAEGSSQTNGTHPDVIQRILSVTVHSS